jgi:hypothetical protein
VVERGVLTLRSRAGDPPVVAAAAGGAIPTATPSAAGALQVVAGQAVILPMGSSVTVDNESSAPAALIWLVSNPDNSFDLEGRGTTYDYLADLPTADLPAPPVVVTLTPVVLAPGAARPAPAAPGVAIGPVDDARYADLLHLGGGAVRNQSSRPLAIYVLTVSSLRAGTPIAGTPTG